VNLCCADLSILKVILVAVTMLLPCRHRDHWRKWMQSRGHTQTIENRLPEAGPDDEVSASAEFSGVEGRDSLLLRYKLVSLDFQLLDFGIQR
jgi:hypothetical protein